MRYAGVLMLVALALVAPLSAQQSTNYTLEEHTFNSGGDPKDGVILTSASYQITLDSIGDTVAAQAMSSASYSMDEGFSFGYPPPGEALNLKFSDETTLYWDPERSIGSYNLYRGDIVDLGTGYGTCQPPELLTEQATDTDTPSAGHCFFYLVTAENSIDEEGTMGSDSSGSERGNGAPCP